MKANHKAKSFYSVHPSIKVIFCPKVADQSAFSDQASEVQNLVAQMVLKGRKRGRPSKREEIYEEAA